MISSSASSATRVQQDLYNSFIFLYYSFIAVVRKAAIKQKVFILLQSYCRCADALQ